MPERLNYHLFLQLPKTKPSPPKKRVNTAALQKNLDAWQSDVAAQQRVRGPRWPSQRG